MKQIVNVLHEAWGTIVTATPRLSAVDADYYRGVFPPQYPVPALKHVITFDGIGQDYWSRSYIEKNFTHDSVVVWKALLCPSCKALHLNIVAVWDFHSDRCRNHFILEGEYVNSRQLREGIDAMLEMNDMDVGVS